MSTRWWRGDFSKRFLVYYWFPLAAAVFLAGGAVSAHHFQGQFDWRFCTLSSLSSAVSNPAGYVYSCLGLIISFTLAIPLCGYFEARVTPFAPKVSKYSCRWLRVGFIGSIAVGAERFYSQALALRFGKLHEYLSLVTFVGLALGLTGFSFGLVVWLVSKRRWSKFALRSCLALSTIPIFGTGVSQAYLYFVPNDLGWVGPHWASLGVPLYLSLAFWEWLLATAIFAYLYVILLFLPKEPPSSKVP